MNMTIDEMKDQVTKQYNKNQRQIANLFNTHTSVNGIKLLTQQNEWAYANELKRLETAEFFLDLSHATKLKVMAGLYDDLNMAYFVGSNGASKTAVRTSKMIAILEKCF